MSKIAAWAHERDSQAAFVSETGVPAHERDLQAAFVSKTGVPAHERDPQTAFVSETGVPAHERDLRDGLQPPHCAHGFENSSDGQTFGRRCLWYGHRVGG